MGFLLLAPGIITNQIIIMALIKCIECGTEVSDLAEKCPKCAYPISSKKEEVKVQTIEQTSKKYKMQLVVGVVVLILGFIFLGMFDSKTIGIIFLILGVIMVISTKIAIWWHHK